MVKQFHPTSPARVQASLRDILRLEKECFPESFLLAYGVSEEYYRNSLHEAENLNLFFEEESLISGYLLGVPLEKALQEIMAYDTDMNYREKCLYIDTVQVTPASQGRGVFSAMLSNLITKANEQGFSSISLHARTTNMTDSKTRHVFAAYNIHPIEDRILPCWHFGGNEPYRYLCFPVVGCPSAD